MGHLGPWIQSTHMDRCVLVHRHHLPALRADHLEQPVRAIGPREDPLLDLRRQARGVRQDPDLDEAHRLGLGRVQLRMERTRAEGHALDRPCRQRPERATDVVLVPERSLDHVGEALDVPMWVEGPDRAGDQAVVVEDAHGAEGVVLRIAVAVEAEMPPSAEPATIGVMNLVVAPDEDHRVRS